MARLDTMIQELIEPVESALRLAPKVLAWFEPAQPVQPATTWAWLADDEATHRPGLDISEFQMPGDVFTALFGPALAQPA